MPTQLIRTELKRKLFHLTGLIYVAGLFLLPRTTYLAFLIVLLILELATEFLRLKHPNVREFFWKIGGSLLRSHEQTGLTGVTWMTAGALGATLIASEPRLAATALLYLIFGDGIASLAGLSLQGPHWPNSPRRVSGSAACFIACLLIGIFFLRPFYGWNGVIFGALAATVIEANGLFNLNDNFLIPVVSAFVFVLTYNL